MGANYLNFVSSMIYGDLGATELGPPAAGTKNHLNFTRDWYLTPPAAGVAGNQFLAHHLDVMLSRYEAWRSIYFLPPVRPWDGSDAFPDDDPATAPIGPTVPPALSGGPFPAGWTTNDLGTAVRAYYNALRNYVSPAGNAVEMDDEVKAPFSYRYWAFMKWVSDLRRRLLGQPVFPVGVVYDQEGTILAEKEFADVFHQVHHVWHPNGGAIPSWTQPTPGFKTGVAQHRRKRQISRTQVGAEFFAFHRDHLLLFDRWLSRTGQDPVQSINTCAHDTAWVTPTPSDPGWPAALNALDVVPKPSAATEPEDFWQDFLGPGADMPPGLGYPLVNYGATPPTVDLNPAHATYWDGDLKEFSSVGEMGQRFALDFNPFPAISVPGTADAGYHGIGHLLNGDLAPPVANNYVPRFFAWHGFIDDLWTKREPRFVTFAPVQADGSDFPRPQALIILRDFTTSADTLEPTTAVPGVNLANGNGTLRVKARVRPDPFNRPLELRLTCDVLREAGGSAPVISLSRNLVITVGSPASANERQVNVDFIEDFVFNGTAGTVDAGGKGPFGSDNSLFPPAGPSSVGFLNSLIRVTGTLSCKQKPDGTIPSAAGTISSAGTTVTGNGTAFQTLFRQGDLLRAAGEVRMITGIASNSSLTLYEPFSSSLPAATAYERLDGFDHEETIEIPLVQEKRAPEITAYLDRSSFSKDQVDAIVSAGQSVFNDAFYIALQDRTDRPAPIAWPPEVEPLLRGLIAPRIRAAGLYPDPQRALAIELRDAATNAPLAGQVDVAVTAGVPEDPSLHPSIPQRITYRCRVTFTGNGAFAGMNPGDMKDLKLVITATDRSGNRIIDDSPRVRLQVSANPYMLDGPVSWLSVDARVFKIQQGQPRFGVAQGWSDPNVFIQQVIANLRAGNGTAGGESFNGLPTDQAAAVLEYSTKVGNTNIYNFALAQVRLQSVTGAVDVRASFRLFRWGVANVAFDPTLAYRTHGPTGIALLGRTASDELASIPFYARSRVAASASMTTQTDPDNLFSYGPTGGGEAVSFFGAYLDINQSTLLFPQTFLGDGGFGGVPPANMRTIRDLLISQHQCMIVELVYPPDPTVPGATPGSSDNLSQRNLLILQTANPGTEEITRTVQHSFNIDLTRRYHRQRRHPAHTHERAMPEVIDMEPNWTEEREHEQEDLVASPRPARPVTAIEKEHDHHVDLDHLSGSWLEQAPRMLKGLRERGQVEAVEAARWQIDPDGWKPTDGLDELVFFWNKLPAEARIELYLPGINVEEILNYRNLRHAPATVKIVDSHTLRLFASGPTYLPIPPFWGDNLAGLVTIALPAGIRAGQKFLVDVVHMRSDRRQVLGGFQINIQVGKAKDLAQPEIRLLERFHQRLSLTPKSSRWRPILEKQVSFLRGRARGFVDQANNPDLKWEDPTEHQQGLKVRVVLERIQRLRGEDKLAFVARVWSPDNGGQFSQTRLPIGNKTGESSKKALAKLDSSIFEGFIEGKLVIEVAPRAVKREDDAAGLASYRRAHVGPPELWLGRYGPKDEKLDLEDMGDWRIWYRIELA
jgi:hypothetical protein